MCTGVYESYRETPQQHIGKQQRNSGEALETEHLEKKKVERVLWDKVPHRKRLGTMSSMENAFLRLRHTEFRTTELYVCYS